MPKSEIDYSNTIIYKISCKDTNIADSYVGYTTNFIQRKHAHKQSCKDTSVNKDINLYKIIRENGGWDNWSMEVIKVYNCKDHSDAKKKEQEYSISLEANLNTIELIANPNIIYNFACNKCNITCKTSKLLEQHEKTQKHKKNIEEKQVNKFFCEKCDYYCSKQSEYKKHLLTGKHKIQIGNLQEISGTKKNLQKKPTPQDSSNENSCSICNKKYTTSSGLWKHKRICMLNKNEDTIIEHPIQQLDSSSNEIKILTNLILEMVKSNTELQKQNSELQKQTNELQKQVIEVCKYSNSTINSNNNSNNKTFNLQFFLNEQCKDAMNISDFVNTFDLQLEDLESVGELGYVEGITKLIVAKLNGMDIYKRPMHCSDAKRETIYIKDDDKWEKEERGTPKLRKAIKNISFNNMKLLGKWSDTYPESKNIESRLNDKYIKLVKQSTGGSGEIADSEDKIIRRIAKEITIDKL